MTSIPETFRAYVYESFSDDALKVIKLRSGMEHEALAPDQVRIKVHSAALNPIDYKLIEWGLAFPFATSSPTPKDPFRLGFDAAGTLVEVGADVKHFQVGDQVYAMAYHGSNKTLAEYVVLNAEHVSPKPKNMTFNEAAGVPVAAITSFQSLVRSAKIKTGERVLILGGSSATGAFGIQIANTLGAFVIATTSSRNIELVKLFGADQVIDYTAEKWSEVLEHHSIDVIYDCGVEPQAWDDEAQSILKKDGTARFLTIAPQETWKESPINASFINVYAKPDAKHFSELTKLIEAGELRTPIDSVYEFEDLLKGVKKQKTNHTRGKVVIQVIPEQNY